MKIVLISSFYSEGMGYTENSLPKAFGILGHDTHVITSDLNVYGTSKDYLKNYLNFLGPSKQPIGEYMSDGFTVHRLPSIMIFGYVLISGLSKKLRELNPEIVHNTEVGSLQTFVVAFNKLFMPFRSFAESHQHMSVLNPAIRVKKHNFIPRLFFWMTRTLPIKIASLTIEKCYAISPDCYDVAETCYGIPKCKLMVQSLGTDSQLFHPVINEDEIKDRRNLRRELGYAEDDIVCIYTGRFTEDKNPLLLAKAVSSLGNQWHSLFVGEGPQRKTISQEPSTTILPFMKHTDLARLYRGADIAVWPKQDSMSMLDAASSGLPLVVSDQIGEMERVLDNGYVYTEDDIVSLCETLLKLADRKKRLELGRCGRLKIVDKFSWIIVAKRYLVDYVSK